MVGTSLRGRMIMVFFLDLYDCLCSDMIFDLMSCMNRKQLLPSQVDTIFEYDRSNADRG